jgi:GWxTD domain-containing protein
MKKLATFPILFLALLVTFTSIFSQEEQSLDQEKLKQEEEQDYFRQWLNQDVTYVITDEERTIFEALTTDEEKEQFIEQFWRRRDPDLSTAENEFKEEHYRRIAYANERFASALSGWKTDRGRVYIIHGEPTEVSESFGGPYERPMYEGGGTTNTFPYQTWRYRNIDGMGNDIELEFVDKTLTGDYRLATSHWEKDAFANVPGIGLTVAEEKGLATKRDRFIADGGLAYYPNLALRGKDRPFQRLERYAKIMKAPDIRYTDLKSLVDVEITFSTLPFRLHTDHFRLNDTHVIVPVTLEFANRDLDFKDENGVHRAKVAVYGSVSDLGQRIVNEFEDDVMTALRTEQLERGRLGTAMYQKLLVLEKGRRVKLNLVVKDLNSGKVGAVSRAIVPPGYDAENLQTSSLVLSDTMQKLENIPDEDEMFVLGDTYIRPSLDRRFPMDKLMGAYVQVYNAGIDQ